MIPPLRLIMFLTPVLAAAGCQRPSMPVFPEHTPPIRWPAEPDPARIRYVGSLVSSADLKPPRSLLQGIVEVFAGAKTPERLYGPRSVIVTGGGRRVWIADTGGGCLHMFDLQDRSYKKIVFAGGERLLGPADLCPGPGESIFVCDAEGMAIHQLSDVTGELRRSLRLPDELQRPVALSYDSAAEELFVVDVAAHDVKVLSTDGRLRRIIGRRGTGAGEFNYPCDVVKDGAVIWIADAGNQRVQGLTLAGDPVVTFGGAGDAPGEMALPKGIATDSDGNVYVVDARFENVQIFDPTGNLLLVIGQEGIGPGEFWLPSGIFIDTNDRIWICDTYNRRVQVFDRVKDTGNGGQP